MSYESSYFIDSSSSNHKILVVFNILLLLIFARIPSTHSQDEIDAFERFGHEQPHRGEPALFDRQPGPRADFDYGHFPNHPGNEGKNEDDSNARSSRQSDDDSRKEPDRAREGDNNKENTEGNNDNSDDQREKENNNDNRNYDDGNGNGGRDTSGVQEGNSRDGTGTEADADDSFDEAGNVGVDEAPAPPGYEREQDDQPENEEEERGNDREQDGEREPEGDQRENEPEYERERNNEDDDRGQPEDDRRESEEDDRRPPEDDRRESEEDDRRPADDDRYKDDRRPADDDRHEDDRRHAYDDRREDDRRPYDRKPAEEYRNRYENDRQGPNEINREENNGNRYADRPEIGYTNPQNHIPRPRLLPRGRYYQETQPQEEGSYNTNDNHNNDIGGNGYRGFRREGDDGNKERYLDYFDCGNPKNIEQQVDSCDGKGSSSASSYDRRKPQRVANIIHGTTASPHTWPWQVALLKYGKLKCGGSMISQRWIVTAAHCVERGYKNDFRILVGSHNLLDRDDGSEIIEIAGIHIHPDWNRKILKNDIALIKLKKPIKFNKKIQPICLPIMHYNVKGGAQCHATGWGLTENGRTKTLQQTCLSVSGEAECLKYNRFPKERHTVCSQSQGTNVCFGDSGGPLMCSVDGRWTLVGISSFVHGTCYGTSFFTKVAAYADFIKNTLKTQ
ncbi:unnamed protein product [Gordionus sp. m RMFG-2023]